MPVFRNYYSKVVKYFSKNEGKIIFFFFLSALLLSYPLPTEGLAISQRTEFYSDIQIPEGLDIPEDMVYVPDGYFIMGDNSSVEEEKPPHQVYVKDFLIDKYEVSNMKYEKFLQETGYPVPKYWYDEKFNKPNQPVVGVSWEDAAAYAKWAKKRLPTEAEWEKAAKGPSGFIWPWGNDLSEKNDFSFYLNLNGTADNFEFTSPVDFFVLGISPYKVFNMAGNVWEWCQDWFDPHYYKRSPEINPRGPKTGEFKVLRGGSWINKIYNASTTRRIRNYPYIKLNIYGFRCAQSIY